MLPCQLTRSPTPTDLWLNCIGRWRVGSIVDNECTVQVCGEHAPMDLGSDDDLAVCEPAGGQGKHIQHLSPV